MFWNIVIGIASFLLNLVLSPKPQNAKAASLEDFNIPTAEEGIEISVLFGTRLIQSPNCVWYGDLTIDDVKGARRYGFFGPRQVTGHKYSLSMQFVLCHAVHDLLRTVTVGEKNVLAVRDAITGSGTATIDMNDLFGGDKSEGGISGNLHIFGGEPTQDQNAYLANILDEPNLPAFRGEVTVLLQNMYIGTSPYMKPWAFEVKRIHKTSQNATQWYDAKAAVPEASGGSNDPGLSLPTGDGGTLTTRQVMTKGNWAVVSEESELLFTGSPFTTHIWDLRDGTVRELSAIGPTVVGGYCFITSDDELLLRTGGDIWGGGGTSLAFYDF